MKLPQTLRRACCFAALAILTRLTTAAPLPSSPAELFSFTNIWSIHLKFTPEQWKAIQPTQGGGGPPRAFGPGMFLGPKLFEVADANKDAKVTVAEFDAAATRLHTDWSKGQAALNTDHLKDGLNALITNGPAGAPAPQRSMLQGAEGKRNGIASAMGFEFPTGKADIEFNGATLKDASIRHKGNGTFLLAQGTHKKSFKIDLDDNIKTQAVGRVTKLNLHNNVMDGGWMNESLSYRLFREAKVPAPRTAYARVYVTVPGEYDKKYFGLYSLVENVDGDFAREQLGTKKGAFFKPVTNRPFEDMGDDWKPYNQPYDPKDDVTPAQKQRLIAFCKFVSHASDEEFNAKFGEWVDIDNFSRYMATLVWLAELDGILGSGQNYYVHLHPETQKFQFIPWDMDHSFGTFSLRGTQEERNELSIHKPWGGETRFLARAFKVPAFKTAYLARLQDLSKTLATPERLAQQVDLLASVLRPAVQEESPEKLARFDKLIAGESSAASSPGGFPMMGATQPVKAFAKVRAASVAAQLKGESKGLEIGDFGFGGPPRGGRGRGQGGPGGGMPAPSEFIAPGFLAVMDRDKDQSVSRDEFLKTFANWRDNWRKGADALTLDQITEGLNEQFTPPGGGRPGGFGPPPGGPGPGPVVRPFPRE
ncbi:MAG TPA: CotH kinase family protein [Methylomirabilota bacterium]|nr:CotH kinase family protein [Methylomirabilota bacterium]